MSRVELHIERVVLDGITLDRRGARRFEAALATRLRELLAEAPSAVHDAPAAAGGANVRALRAAPVALDPAAGPAAMGEQVAGAIHGALGGGR
jgi:hypothetical protein